MTVGLGDKADIFGDYYKNTEDKTHPYLWTAGLGLGKTSMHKPGSFRVAGQYVKAKAYGYIGENSTYTAFPLNTVQDKDVNFWLASADVVLAKNVTLHGEYAFDVKEKGDDVKYDNIAAVALNYAF